MANLIDNSAIVLVAATGIQQTVELLDSVVFSWWCNPEKDPTKNAIETAVKRAASFVLALLLLASAPTLFPSLCTQCGLWQTVWYAVALAGGTDGVNSILKYLNYSKENKKNDAAQKLEKTDQDSLQVMRRK
jgi:hypothetical protein